MTLAVRGLSVGFGSRLLHRDLSFSVTVGARLAVAGPSGSGKTSLLRVLAWLDPPLAGTVELDGRPPRTHGVPRYRRQVVYVAQRAEFFGGCLRDELARPLAYGGAPRALDESAVGRSLEALGLRPGLAAPVEELSEGERQRLALLRAALLQPRVLLLDEPTSALDPAATTRVEAWLSALPAALVLVSHDPDQRARLAGDAVLELGAGDG